MMSSTEPFDADERHCKFYLKKKKRFCRFLPKANADYCPEHACVMGIQEERKRVPCPLNPNHNCYEDDLDKHLKKCNVTKIRQAIENQPYFIKDINKGAVVCSNTSSDSLPKTKCVKDLTSDKLREIIEKVNKLFSEVVGKIEKVYLEHPIIKREITGSTDEDLTKAFGSQAVYRKEMLQQASLVGQLESVNLMNDGNCFVELGAGKGKLSHWILKASKENLKSSFLLVERSSVRYKVDPCLKADQEKGERFQRIKIDIQNLCLGKVSSIQDKTSIVVVGKHLCGGATDLGIRCAVNTLDKPSNFPKKCVPSMVKTDCSVISKSQDGLHDESPTSFTERNAEHTIDFDSTSDKKSLKTETQSTLVYQNSGVFPCVKSIEPSRKVQRLQEETLNTSNLQGIMIALCCHHRCTWDTYVGQEFMIKHGINEEEFDLLTRLSSWATCARTRVKGKTISGKKDTDEEVKEQSEDTGKGEMEENEKGEHNVEDLIGNTADDNDSTHLREKLNVSEREEIGRKAKRILDMGRIEYLQSKNMHCFLREYINDAITPENIVLLAIPSKPVIK